MKFEPQVKAPIGFYKLRRDNPKKFAAICGGCGPGQWGDYFVPDTLWGLSIRLACQVHDYMYYVGRTAEDKWRADSMFLQNMLALIWKGSNWLTFPLRVLRAAKYYIAVARHGDNAFYGEDHEMESGSGASSGKGGVDPLRQASEVG